MIEEMVGVKHDVGAGKFMRSVVLTLVVLGLVASTGCSRLHRQTTPFGEASYSVDVEENANRINGWPLLYHRGDATSVLWPLFQKSKDGHMVLAAYEWRNPNGDDTDRELFVAMGLLANLAFDDKDYRVLNTSVDKDRKDYSFFPLIFGDYDERPELLVLPLFYYEKQNQRSDGEERGDTFYSIPFSKSEDTRGETFTNVGLLFTRVASEDREHYKNLLFPLWNYERTKQPGEEDYKLEVQVGPYSTRQRNDRAKSRVFPVAFWWHSKKEDGSGVVPLYYNNKEENGDSQFYSLPMSKVTSGTETLVHAGLLFLSKEDEERDYYKNMLFPFWNYDRLKQPGDAEYEKYLQAGTYFSKTEGEDSSSAAFPLAYWWEGAERKGSAVFPLYHFNKEGNGDYRMISLPVWKQKKGGKTFTCVGPALALESKFEQEGDLKKMYRSLGWLYHSWQGGGEVGNMLLPLYRWASHADGGHTVNTLLYNEHRSEDGGLTNVGGPLFYTKYDNEDCYTAALWPLFQRWRKGNGDGADLMFPFFFRQKDGDSTLVDVAGPLYIDKKEKDSRFTSLLWPFFQRHREGDEGDGTDVAFPLYFNKREGEEKITNVAGLVFIHKEDERSSYTSVLWPFLQQWRENNGEEKTDMLFPALFSQRKGEDEGVLNLLGLLFHRAWDKDGHLTFVTPLTGWWKNKERSGLWQFPLFYKSKEGEEKTFVSLPFSFSKKQGLNHWWNIGGLIASYEKNGDRRKWGFLKPFIGGNSRLEGKTWSQWFFPLYSVGSNNGDFYYNSLLYDYRNGLIDSLDEVMEVEAKASKARAEGKSYYKYSSRSFSTFMDFVRVRKSINLNVVPKGQDEEERKNQPLPEHFPIMSSGVDVTALFKSSQTTDELPEVFDGFMNDVPREEGSGDFKKTKMVSVLPLLNPLFSKDIGFLWDSRSEWVSDTAEPGWKKHRRFLLKVYESESIGSVSSVDVFPFITIDRDTDKDYRAFSFLGPIYRRITKGEQWRLQVLGIPFGDKVEMGDSE